MMPKPAMRYNRQVCDALPSSTTHRGSPDVAGWSAYPSIAVISISLPDRRDGPRSETARAVGRFARGGAGAPMLCRTGDGPKVRLRPRTIERRVTDNHPKPFKLATNAVQQI